MWSAEDLARYFHQTYEALAPSYEFRDEFRESTRVDWEDVPDNNRALMVHVAGQVIDAMREDGVLGEPLEAELVSTPTPTFVVNIDLGDQTETLIQRVADEVVGRLGDA